MLRSNHHERLIAARLLDFFGAETPWQRRAWDVGTCVALHELVEASEAVIAGALSPEAVSWLAASTSEISGRDLGMGTPAQRSTLTTALKGRVSQGSFDTRLVAQILDATERRYLASWAAAAEEEVVVGAERCARSIAGHMLGLGFSAEYLHRWWGYRIKHEEGERSLAELLRDADARVQETPVTHQVLVPLQRATARVQEIPGWIEPAKASAMLTPINRKPIDGLAGALLITATAHDPSAAVEVAAETIDRYVARITLAGRNEGLTPFPYVWVRAEDQPRHVRLRLRTSRGLEVPVLLRRDAPITESVEPRIDSSLELLGPVDRGSLSSAVAGGWAAVETLLTAPGDKGKVQAADRLAALVACSFPRAELTMIVNQVRGPSRTTNARLADDLDAAHTNSEAAALAACALAQGIMLTDATEGAAVERLRRLVAQPRTTLRDVECHLQRTFRRLYRVRNLVLHNAATDSITLGAALRTAVPPLGAGIDRLVRGALLHGIDPLDLAARARTTIDNADHIKVEDLADLLRLADT